MIEPPSAVAPPEGDRLADYDFALPGEAIALRPAVPRDAARLLVSTPTHPARDHVVRDLPTLLKRGDLLVVNDSRVVPARLTGTRERGPHGVPVELTLLSEAPPGVWEAFAKPARRLAEGDLLRFGPDGSTEAQVVGRDGARVSVRFAASPLAVGDTPLPPYIAARRAADARDRSDYQTLYAAHDGSVAAPTAGLHFTEALLARLADAGVAISRVTLHVGAGTFLPVTAERIDDHAMHAETGTVDANAAEAVAATRSSGGRVVAVGTTAMRLLESAARGGTLAPFDGPTDLFIRPGFSFHVVDALMTNFHLPRTTLLMLVAAFVGLERQRAIYAHALAQKYRFASYGDSSLLFPDP